MTALVDALKAKYGTPANALRALGMPMSLLGGRHAMDEGLSTDELASLRKLLAKDDASENESASPADRLHKILAGKLSPEELKRVGELLEQLSAPGEEEDEEGERADGDPRDLGDEYEVEDEEPSEPSFRKSRNLEPGKTAMDAGFFSRYPAAARVTSDGGLWVCRPENAPRPSQSVAQDADFYSRFPAARRIA